MKPSSLLRPLCAVALLGASPALYAQDSMPSTEAAPTPTVDETAAPAAESLPTEITPPTTPESAPSVDVPPAAGVPGVPIIEEGCLDLGGRTWLPMRADGEGNESPTRVVVTSVDFQNNRVTVQNVTEAPISFDAEGGWSIAIWPRTEDLPEGIVLPAGHALAIHLTESAPEGDPAAVPNPTLHHVYLGLTGGSAEVDPDAGEFAILSNNKPSNPFADPAELEAFVRWGSPSMAGTASLDDEAARARLWVVSSFIGTAEDDLAIVATGSATEPAGWVATTPNCID